MSDPSIGIDLGTTNSAVAAMVDGAPRVIERRTGQRLLPSMVGFTPSGERVVGEAARFLAETHPENVAWATKRFMGQRWSPQLAARFRTSLPFPLVAGPNEDVRVKIAGRTLPVVEIGAMVLTELRLDAEAALGAKVYNAVITVPANFNDAQRQATKEAAKLAGLRVLRLLNEPTAASLAYGLSTGFTGRALVFDLGGGTFDVSVLEIRDGVFEVVATGGDPFLGGEDFDEVLVQWLIAQLRDPVSRDRVAHNRGAQQRLKVLAEQAKCAVSTTEEARISAVLLPDVKGNGIPLESMLTRAFFERIAWTKITRCLEIVDGTLAEAKIAPESIDRLLLVGGMTRVPLVRKLVTERFKREPAAGVNPDEVVAVGAAIHAAELAARVGKVLLLDVVSNSLGVGIAGGACKVVIKKNTPLPARATEVFHPSHDGQTIVRIPVLQGESTTAAQDFRLGELTLDKLQSGQRAQTAIEVTFEMGTEGILSVEARDAATGRAESARIVARAEVAEEELKRIADQEEKHRLLPEALAQREERSHAVAVRAALREAIANLRILHEELRLAAAETGGDPKAKAIVEQVGQRLVEADRVEQGGSLQEVVALDKELRELHHSITGAPPPPVPAA